MAKEKRSFILYTDLLATVKKMVIKDRENKTNNGGEFFLHLLQYVSDENPEPINDIVELTFEGVKQQLKRDLLKYEGKRIQQSEAGKASAEAKRLAKEIEDKKRSTDSTNVEIPSTNPTVSVSVNVNGNEIKENISPSAPFPFFKSLTDYGFEVQLVKDWLKVRKKKKATDTETAFKGFISEVVKCGADKNLILKKCVEKSWAGFESEWYAKELLKEVKKVYN